MKKDIEFPRVEGVILAVTRQPLSDDSYSWSVHMINRNSVMLHNILVSSKGYGEKDGEKQETSTLRHFIETLPANDSALIEQIDPGIFHLFNEFWVSYYIDNQIYDRKFLFVPETLKEENLQYIKDLEMEGILHS